MRKNFNNYKIISKYKYMGNVINKESDSINWNNVKTNQFSERNGNIFLSDDSKLLASKLVLNIPDLESSESNAFSDVEKIFNKYQVVSTPQQNGSELSDTSPFISSEMYKYLMNKTQVDEVKVGGGLKQKGGAVEEDSSTSSTSSSEEIGSKNKQHEKKNKKNNKKQHSKEKEDSEKEDSEKEDSEEESMTGGASDNLSYVSSSAHESSAGNSNESTSQQNTTESVSNANNQIPPSSINTSDINMISESS
jgi:hypothetical protein